MNFFDLQIVLLLMEKPDTRRSCMRNQLCDVNQRSGRLHDTQEDLPAQAQLKSQLHPSNAIDCVKFGHQVETQRYTVVRSSHLDNNERIRLRRDAENDSFSRST